MRLASVQAADVTVARWAWRSGSAESVRGAPLSLEEPNGLSCPFASVNYMALDGCSKG